MRYANCLSICRKNKSESTHVIKMSIRIPTMGLTLTLTTFNNYNRPFENRPPEESVGLQGAKPLKFVIDLGLRSI